MYSRIEELISGVYRKWKAGKIKKEALHPDEEALACFLEGKLGQEEAEEIKAHLINCDFCSEAVALNLKMKPAQQQEVPEVLSERLKDMFLTDDKSLWLEIILLLKEKAMEIINTTGDVLVGQELMPAPLLRSRSIKEFKDEITILKNFRDIQVEAKIENKAQKAFNVIIVVKQKNTQKIIKDIRVTLIKDDLELESCLADSGSVIFENVLVGKYKVEISGIDERVASILLDIRV